MAQLTETIRQIAGGTCCCAQPLHQESIQLADSVRLFGQFFHEMPQFRQDKLFHREPDGVF